MSDEQTTQNDELWTPDETAAFLKISKSALYNLTSKKGIARCAVPIPHFHLLKALRFRKAAIIAWVNELEKV
jgi:predicted DNA-binding transcriptional regulator AlpA